MRAWLAVVLNADLTRILALVAQNTFTGVDFHSFKESVEFFTSADGVIFTSAGTITPDANGVWADERKMQKTFNNTSARYVRVLAKNYGIIPAGAGGSGTPAWLFADEIEVE